MLFKGKSFERQNVFKLVTFKEEISENDLNDWNDR